MVGGRGQGAGRTGRGVREEGGEEREKRREGGGERGEGEG